MGCQETLDAMDFLEILVQRDFMAIKVPRAQRVRQDCLACPTHPEWRARTVTRV